MTGAVQPEATGAAAPGTMLERIFGDGCLVRDEHQVDGARNMLQGFIRGGHQGRGQGGRDREAGPRGAARGP